MPDEFVAEALRDLLLQPFDLGTGELNHLAGLEVDEVIVVLARCPLIAGASILKRMALKDPLGLKAFHGAIDGGE